MPDGPPPMLLEMPAAPTEYSAVDALTRVQKLGCMPLKERWQIKAFLEVLIAYGRLPGASAQHLEMPC